MVHNIFIVHAIPLIRLGLTSAITETTGLKDYGVSAYTSLAEAGADISKAETGDVLIFDVGAWSSLVSPDHVDALQRIRAHGPSLGVITPTKQGEPNHWENFGLSGAITLAAELEDIVSMVEELAASRPYIVKEPVPDDRSCSVSSLSPRQTEILELMSLGLSNKQIAWELKVTEGNVKYHVTKILRKLGCHQRTQAVVAYMQAS